MNGDQKWGRNQSPMGRDRRNLFPLMAEDVPLSWSERERVRAMGKMGNESSKAMQEST